MNWLFVGIANSALFAAIIAVLGGALVAYVINKLIIIRETKAYIRGIHYWIKISKKKIVSQRDYCINCLNKFQDRRRFDVKEFTHTPQLLNKVDQFDFIQLIRIIQVNSKKVASGKNIEIVYDILKVAEFLNALEDEMQRKYVNYKQDVLKIKDHWYEEIKDFHMMFGRSYAHSFKTSQNCCNSLGMAKLYKKMKFNDILNVEENKKDIKATLSFYDDCISNCSNIASCVCLIDYVDIAMQANHLLCILDDFKQKEDDMAEYMKLVIFELNSVCDIIDKLSIMEDLKPQNFIRVI